MPGAMSGYDRYLEDVEMVHGIDWIFDPAIRLPKNVEDKLDRLHNDTKNIAIKYQDEDDQMLQRLIEIRRTL